MENDGQTSATFRYLADVEIADYINLDDEVLVSISEFIDPLRIKALTVDLDFWGRVNIVAFVIDGNKPYPVAYLTTEDGDVIYRIGSWQVGFEVFDIVVKDINEDGLKDIMVVTHFPYTEDSENRMHIEWDYLQAEDGTFYLSESRNLHFPELSIKVDPTS